MELLINGDKGAWAVIGLCIMIGLMASTELILKLRSRKFADLHLYKGWDDAFYITDKFDQKAGLVTKLKGLKGLLIIIAFMGYKTAWVVLTMRSTKGELIVIN